MPMLVAMVMETSLREREWSSENGRGWGSRNILKILAIPAQITRRPLSAVPFTFKQWCCTQSVVCSVITP